jgi:hypothetical protein
MVAEGLAPPRLVSQMTTTTQTARSFLTTGKRKIGPKQRLGEAKATRACSL